MKLSTSAMMREMDDFTINTLKTPSTLLMTNAAEHVAKAALELMGENRSAVIFCGSGNNGGDGVAAGVYLKKLGVSTELFLVGKREKMTPDTLEMERRYAELGGEILDFSREDAQRACRGAGVIIDAMFGVGLNSDMRGAGAEAVDIINSAAAPVVAADIASGVEADTGRILGRAVKADVTVTFSMAKPGHFSEPGCVFSGKVLVKDIGIPDSMTENAETKFFAVAPGEISLPKRERISHKGDYGKVLIAGGSVGYTGAPVLSAAAASRCGSGLIWLGVPEDIYAITAVRCLEAMPFPAKKPEDILDRLSRCDACLIGPGMGNTEKTAELVRLALESARTPLILDADGINAVSGNIDVLKKAGCPVILTPHEGEFQRLGGAVGSGGRMRAASDFAQENGCILVLKGHRTVTAFPDGTAWVNTTGNPGMARGGSGDVLAGMVLSFAGQGFPIKDAVLAAVYLHGLAGDMCAGKFGEYSMTPGDMLNMLPEAVKSVTEV